MPNPLALIERAVTAYPSTGQDVPTAVAVATDVFAVLAVGAADLDPRMELPIGLLRVGELDVEHDEALPAGMIEVR